MGEQVKELFNWARRRKIMASFFVAFTLVTGIMIGSVISGRVSAMKSFSGTNATPLTVPDPIPSASSFSTIVNRVEPAVVNIATTQKVTDSSRNDPNLEELFKQFFDRQNRDNNGGGDNGDNSGGDNGGSGGSGGSHEVTSLGSGFIIDATGYVVTNNHVIDGAEEITVRTQDNTEYKAKLIGHDPKTDLALLKIESPTPTKSPLFCTMIRI